MYKSPIELLVSDSHHQIVKQQEDEIYKSVLHYVPNVNRGELIRALQYDREQYQKGYADGKADAEAAVVRCWECKHRGDEMVCPMCHERCCDDGDGHLDVWNEDETKDNGFCHKGERREEDGT